MARRRYDIPMPKGVQVRGLGHQQAAAYVGLSVDKFDSGVKCGDIPKPALIGGMEIWDRLELDNLFNSTQTASDTDEAAKRLRQWRQSA